MDTFYKKYWKLLWFVWDSSLSNGCSLINDKKVFEIFSRNKSEQILAGTFEKTPGAISVKYFRKFFISSSPLFTVF